MMLEDSVQFSFHRRKRWGTQHSDAALVDTGVETSKNAVHGAVPAHVGHPTSKEQFCPAGDIFRWRLNFLHSPQAWVLFQGSTWFQRGDYFSKSGTCRFTIFRYLRKKSCFSKRISAMLYTIPSQTMFSRQHKSEDLWRIYVKKFHEIKPSI